MPVLIFVFLICCQVAYSQDFLPGVSAHSLPDSIEINRQAVESIDFGINFDRDAVADKSGSLFLGVESLPDIYIKDKWIPGVTLAPYKPTTKYYENPIKGMDKMMSDCFGKKFSTEVDLNLPYTKGSFHNLPTGGVGFTFSLEDVLQYMFSKSYRDKKRNARNAVTWKHY